MTPQAIVDDIVAFELTNMFGNTDDRTDPDADIRSLERYLYRQNCSREQATKVAAAYNAFVVRRAQATGRPAKNAAIVEPNRHGFRLWFPLVTSGVQKIAHQARQALQAAAA